MGFLSGRKLETEIQFYFSEQHNSDEVNTYKHADDDYFGTLTKLNQSLIVPPSVFKSFMVGFCNGLVCYVGNPKSTTRDRDHEIEVHIYNPVTGKHSQLPAVECSCNAYARMTIGFGYIRSSNKYKFISILCNSSYRPGKVQVCTLRGGAGTGWRSKTIMFKKDLMIYLNDILQSAGVFAGGALNWIGESGKKPKILAFDLEHETFEFVRPIPFIVRDSTNRVGLLELGGNVCVPEVVPREHITMWELKYRKTTKYAQKHKADQSYWLKRFRVRWEDLRCFEPFALTNLLWYNVILSCYYPETNILRKTDEILKKLKDGFMKEVFTTKATSHVHSLASCS